MKELWSHEAELNLLPGKKVSLHRGRDSMPTQSSTHLVPPNEMLKAENQDKTAAAEGSELGWGKSIGGS